MKPHPPDLHEEILNSLGILWTEIVPPGDDREFLFDEAKKKEILGLIEQETFKITLWEEPDQKNKPNILLSRFVLTIKHNDGADVFKARFVIGGHRKREKESMVHQSYNLKQSCIKILLPLTAILGFDIWGLDGKQAYIESGFKLKRKVFIKPNILQLNHDELIQILLT